MTFIAGQYTATLNAAALGQTKTGFTTDHQLFKKEITGDNWADSPQDAVTRGVAMFIEYVLLNYDAAGAALALWPYGASVFTQGIVGRLDSSLWKSLILTAVSGTSASSTPATMTMPRAILAAGYPVRLLFAPDEREVPIRQRIYHDASGVFGSTT